jgi:ornithine carbamoyltransferase
VKRDFLRLWDLSPSEIKSIIDRALELKAGKDSSSCPLLGKSIGMLFEKTSTRTRVSFEAGIYQLGGQPIYFTSNDIQLGRGETVSDTARTLSRYLSAVSIRTHAHNRIKEFADNASVPVINALTDLHHPCQALADLMTIQEKKGRLKDTRLTFIGDGNNVANSLIEAAARMDLQITIACPEGYGPDPGVLKEARGSAKNEIRILNKPIEAAKGADVIYTDVWVSMGQENESDTRKNEFLGYQVNKDMLALCKDDAIVMHCLPAHRGEEITADIIDGPKSVVFDQAENRLHTQKALLEFLLA